jgi:hypothetical protein
MLDLIAMSIAGIATSPEHRLRAAVTSLVICLAFGIAVFMAGGKLLALVIVAVPMIRFLAVLLQGSLGGKPTVEK